MIFRLRYQLSPSSGVIRPLPITISSSENTDAIRPFPPALPNNDNADVPCASCNRSVTVASDVAALADMDNLQAQSTQQATATAAADRPQVSAATQNQNTASQAARPSEKPAETAKANGAERKSQFVNSNSSHAALARESAPLRSSAFFSTAAATFHAPSNISQQTVQRNEVSKNTANNRESLGNADSQVRPNSSARVEGRTDNSSLMHSKSAATNLPALNLKAQPSLNSAFPAATKNSNHTISNSLAHPSFVNSKVGEVSMRILQGTSSASALATTPGSELNRASSGLMQNVARSFASFSVLSLSLQNFVVPLFKNMSFESLKISGQKFTEALTGLKTLTPLAASVSVEARPQRSMNMSLQFFARVEKSMLNFFNLMQGTYLKTPQGEMLEGDLLTQQLALLRNLQEKTEKKEKKKKIENKDEFLWVKVQGKEDLLRE